jgi:hypothetical protein
MSDLFEAFGADGSLDVIGANCLDKYKQYYDREYIARHRPILLLKFDGSLPDDWPHTEQETRLAPAASFTSRLILRKRSTATSNNQEFHMESSRLN